MISIFGFRFNKSKKLVSCLKSISGLNFKAVNNLSKSLGYRLSISLSDLKKRTLIKFQSLLFLLNLTYFRETISALQKQNRKQLSLIKHQRAIRFHKGLPVRGQRTKTNSSTAKKIIK